MKKITKKLQLNTETLRTLTDAQMKNVAAGATGVTNCKPAGGILTVCVCPDTNQC